jgi:hypothetical protein
MLLADAVGVGGVEGALALSLEIPEDGAAAAVAQGLMAASVCSGL